MSWRAHPDYRHEVCFDNATRANLGGLTHKERVFIGVALLHRYKNSRAGSRFEPLFDILTPDQVREAEVLGKAMRFGAMFSANSAEHLGSMRWMPKKKVLELRLPKASSALFGEVSEARFASLATAIGAETVMTKIS